MTPKQDINKIIRVTVKVFIKIVAIFFGGSIFSYYCIISYAHLFPELQHWDETSETAVIKSLHNNEGYVADDARKDINASTSADATAALKLLETKKQELETNKKALETNKQALTPAEAASKLDPTANNTETVKNLPEKQQKLTKAVADATTLVKKSIDDVANAQKAYDKFVLAIKHNDNADVANPFFQKIQINPKVKRNGIPIYVTSEKIPPENEEKKQAGGANEIQVSGTLINQPADNKPETPTSKNICGGINFDENDINKQFAGHYQNNKRVDASLLYSLSDNKPDSYSGAKFIGYSMINFMQGLIVADFTIIRTYFEFFQKFCGESFSLMFGWFLLIPFMFIYLFCHIIATMGYSFLAILDLFKMKACDHSNSKDDGLSDLQKETPCFDKEVIPHEKSEDSSSWGSWIWTKIVGKGKQEPIKYKYIPRDHESMTWLELISRIAFIFPLIWINSFMSCFCGFYALFKALSITGTFGKKDSDNKGKISHEFSLLTFMKNNLKFYSRAYLIMFSLLLIYESYVDMNINTAIGCVVAIIILVFGTSIFKKLSQHDDIFTSFETEKCDYDYDNTSAQQLGGGSKGRKTSSKKGGKK
jgi:hypothetical protein